MPKQQHKVLYNHKELYYLNYHLTLLLLLNYFLYYLTNDYCNCLKVVPLETIPKHSELFDQGARAEGAWPGLGGRGLGQVSLPAPAP